ncbi:NAD(P)H-hydrate dehydratase [Microbacterium sp. STN6]|uniref:ADP-dependent NAD(P)H-hydrate dehydratase n=1 Tax=Microbacterium sp. STN6 TaxID=2995588 RepID=UPI002260888C|nr:ADP/ATP-dependent (S)-NAD(P)H-hydrate dehydratase [Microbacterium sp. STN6]MCX7521116.1 NAD(P)H-hydrate dehydratase [Microbacterium sp. STN6]
METKREGQPGTARQQTPGGAHDWQVWSGDDAQAHIAVPLATGDKYSRGVLGVICGSARYPGAAVLSVEAAMRTGVGMVRYVGAKRPSTLVLQRRPEVVTGVGRVQAWLIGSGIDAESRSAKVTARIRSALADGVPVVLDAGALDLVGEATGPVIITPHFRELAVALDTVGERVDAHDIAREPARWAAHAADALGVTVLLKGSTTYVAAPSGVRLTTRTGSGWLATAGTGDVLGGVLGALVATHAERLGDAPATALAQLGATAAYVHGVAAARASRGGPIAALDVAEALPATLRALLAV